MLCSGAILGWCTSVPLLRSDGSVPQWHASVLLWLQFFLCLLVHFWSSPIFCTSFFCIELFLLWFKPGAVHWLAGLLNGVPQPFVICFIEAYCCCRLWFGLVWGSFTFCLCCVCVCVCVLVHAWSYIKFCLMLLVSGMFCIFHLVKLLLW